MPYINIFLTKNAVKQLTENVLVEVHSYITLTLPSCGTYYMTVHILVHLFNKYLF